ncbi:hypothetical protein BCR34DRAFT_500661 [Clohesyomyces aquaticus]|uniref:Caspase domain-domain-containing protein n=1 Tax=Clohesyomyces aquaticus TaxID=1231657 RepID=A0A1Y1Y3D2_9PLEO|nr:hypothetical protein BCR34DRAFT_500661 [Clohesyomyces aquaticus]
MVEKKLKVLLVLDCCFSGRVDRHGDAGNCRFIECDPTINLPNYKLHDSLIETTYTSVNPSTFRDASTWINWVVDPKGYTVLTACGPTEQSFELQIGNNERHGILSYFFVRTLRKLGELKMSHLVIFQFVCAMFKACPAKQTPQLKGNGDLRFFGHLVSSVDMIFPVIKLRNGRLRIQAGEILGVQEREELVLSPLNVLRNEDPAKASVTAVAQHTGGVETDLELADSTFDSSQIDATWVARPLRWLKDAEDPYLGSVTSNYNDNSLEHQVNTENQQASNGLIPPGLTPATAPFKAVVNSQGQFEIRNRADEKVEFDSISLLSPQSKNSRVQVCRLLSHLTRFDEITNVKPRHEDVALRDAIDITLFKSQGRSSLKPGFEFIEARDGESIKISVANKSKIRAYVHMFCLGVGTWEISNLLAAENTELSADPVELEIQMEVPDYQIIRGIRQSEDIIKVFVTTRSAPFINMVMSMPVFRFAEDEALDSWLVHTFRIRTCKC